MVGLRELDACSKRERKIFSTRFANGGKEGILKNVKYAFSLFFFFFYGIEKRLELLLGNRAYQLKTNNFHNN